MKKLLLTLLLALAVGTGAAWAEGYTVVFKKGTGAGSSPSIKNVSNVVSEGVDYITSLSNNTNVTIGEYGLGLATNTENSNGSLTLNLSEKGKVKATKIIFTTHEFNNKTGLFSASVNGAEVTLDTDILGTQTATFTEPVELSTIKLTGSKYRIFISKFEVVTSAEGGEGGEEGGETPEPTPDPTPEGSVKFTMVKNINDINDNDTYIIASYKKDSNEIFLMGTQKSDIRDTVKVETSLYTYPMPDEFVFTEAKTAKVAYLSFINKNITGTYPTFWIVSQKDSEDTTNYISSTTVKKTSLSTTGCNFTLSFNASEYTAALKASVGFLSFNPSAPRFTTYAAIQNPIYIYKLEANNEPLPLEKVTLEGADENGNISVTQGATLKFNAPNAAMYEISGDITADGLVENGKFEYIVNFPEGTDVLNITVTPYDEEPETLEGTASTFTITKIAAPDCGELTFTPASGTAIKAGSTISFSADNAATYHYGINTETESEFSEGASFTVSENDFIDGKCTVRAYPVNGDGKRGATVVAEYTLKEADRYALINNLAHVKVGTKYIIATGYDKIEETINAFGDVESKQASSVVSAAISENIIVPGEAKVNYLDLTNITTNANETTCKIKLANGDYLSAKTSATDLTAASAGSDFTISFDTDGSFDAKTGTREILFLNSSKIFKNYASSNKTNSSYSPVYLYRLIDEEYDTEVPEELYIHGHFYDRYYDLDNPVAMEKTGDKTFSSSDIMFGGNADHTEDALSFVLTTHIPTESVARSHESADWARLTEGKVYHSGGKVAAADVKTGKEITPYTVDKHDYYTISADFSGYAPVITATRQNGITTGVENVDTDATDAPVEYFNLQGVRVDNPGSGIFIRRQGKAVTKVVVK